MNLKAGRLQEADMLLGELMKEKLPIALSWKITRFIKFQFTNEMNLLLEKRRGIAEEFCKRDENGNPVIVNNLYQFEPDNETKANQELSELHNVDISLNFETIDIGSLGNIELSPAALMGLESLGFIKGGDSQ